MTRKKKKDGLKWRTIQVKVPVCPKCGASMEGESNVDARTMWHYKCPKCLYKH